MRGKIKVKLRHVAVAIVVIVASVGIFPGRTKAEGCPDVRIVFARGSGGERWNDQNYLAYKKAIEEKLATTRLSYDFIDLDYPAVGVGIDNLGVTLGAFFGAGEAYTFGTSVNTGVRTLKAMVNGRACSETKYVIGGYSQGAMVVSKALSSLKAERLIYAATFGDPKLYLPEGWGIIPAACRGDNLSSYRMYVPDCQAYKGLLGAYIPYEPEGLSGKVGTWCNRRDIFCSSRFSIRDHVSYVADNLYEDASRVIFDKITRSFGIENHISSPHDTAILIDSTGSMSSLISKYKAEAKRLAEKTWAGGGRVALYDYRDYQEGYQAKQRCSFETCNAETFQADLDSIHVAGGGDTPESLLASSLHVMDELNWKVGSTKSIVVLTDAGYHDPDFDLNGTTRLDVVRLSKQIDPVNFYVITNEKNKTNYSALTEETGGRVATTADDLSELTDYIIARYDSLPRVEEMEAPVEVPTLEIRETEISENTARIRVETNGARILVALDGMILGITEEKEITISELEPGEENLLTLTPLGEDVRGEAVEVKLEMGGRGKVEFRGSTLRAPNAGRIWLERLCLW